MLTQDVRNALDVADLNKLKYDLNSLQPVDVGEYISELPEQQRAIAFRLLNKNQAIDVFEYLPTEVQEELINSLHDVQVVHLVEEMSPDERAYLFDELPAGVVKRLLQQLSPEQRQATATILGYPEGTA
ncbi:MAG: magnesium transporter, partial [Sphaerospermopsis sp.]|nr:magnesium transporter [Sphaerospermopsis sp.]